MIIGFNLVLFNFVLLFGINLVMLVAIRPHPPMVWSPMPSPTSCCFGFLVFSCSLRLPPFLVSVVVACSGFSQRPGGVVPCRAVPSGRAVPCRTKGYVLISVLLCLGVFVPCHAGPAARAVPRRSTKGHSCHPYTGQGVVVPGTVPAALKPGACAMRAVLLVDPPRVARWA